MKRIFLAFLAIGIIECTAQDNINFEIELISGEKISFSEIYSDGPTLINFWALWCKPCRAEMKELNKLYNKYSDQKFDIIGINLDTPRSSAKVKAFISSLGIDYKITLDPNGKIFENFNGQVVPLNLLYDQDGNVVYRHTGYLPGDEFKIENEIKKLLRSAGE